MKFSKNLKFSKKLNSEILCFEKISRKLFQFFLFYKMENIISSLARFTKKEVDSVKKAITQYAGQVVVSFKNFLFRMNGLIVLKN